MISFKEDTAEHLLRCFTEDLASTKIQQAFRRDYLQIKEVLQAEYAKIVAVFLFYSGQSHAYPSMAVEDF